MFSNGKRGFTLVELLVVISILGILAAALTTQVTKARAIGQALRCKANLRNLAQAALTRGVETGGLPTAGSYEFVDINMAEKVAGIVYNLNYSKGNEGGWVAWTGSGKWTSSEPQAGSMKASQFYASIGENSAKSAAYLSITNGALWKYVGKDLSTYCCDVHRKYARLDDMKALRSYVMNSYFGYPDKGNGMCSNRHLTNREVSSLSERGSAGNLLLFAELPARKIDTSERGADSVLEAKIRGYTPNNTVEEMIGFNHEISGSRGGAGGGKRFAAHVAFADGHVDALAEPRGASDSHIKDLTKSLCNGDEITQELRRLMK